MTGEAPASPGVAMPGGTDLRVTEMRELRRDLHAHPELSGEEFRTTGRVVERLAAAGLQPRTLPSGTGLLCDIGPSAPGNGGPRTVPRIALRADLDALPLPDSKNVPYRSTVAEVCHACGHDLHTVVLLGAGLALADLAAQNRLPVAVRLIFQPAEEAMWGARAAIEAGALDGVDQVFALHADPRLPVARIGLRSGAITGAADVVLIRLHGPGGHTARPHLTADLIQALGAIATQTPSAIARRFDPRFGLRLVWGRIAAGSAVNAIPSTGELAGTLRCLDTSTWDAAPELLTSTVEALAAQYGVRAEVEITRGVPPCVNDPGAIRLARAAAAGALGPEAVADTEQSLGGEDFAWFTRSVPGALIRLGTGSEAVGTDIQLHQPQFDVDEGAIEVGIRLLLAIVDRAGQAGR